MPGKKRPNPKAYSIIDECPQCKQSYGWNACTDEYDGARQEVGQVEDRTIQLEICPKCNVVIAVQVLDDRGGEVYVPSTKPL